MENKRFQNIANEPGARTIKDSGNAVYAEIFVQGNRCTFRISPHGDAKFGETNIVCQSEEEAIICQTELAQLILTGDPNALNWYLGMDFEDVEKIFSGKELRFAHYKESVSSMDDAAARINARFSGVSDLFIYVEGSHTGGSILDRITVFPRWAQFSLNESMDSEIKISLWYV